MTVHRTAQTHGPITRKGEPPLDADAWKDKPGKGALFSPKRGA